MSTTSEQREQTINAAIREISHIATLPEITLKIIELVEDPSSTAQDLHEVINNDPALCARILKVVNSSFYGLPGQIASINRAIVMLGLNAVKNIAIAASLAKLFRGGALTPSFGAKDLWTHSNATAAACKVLADTVKVGLGDEAYLAGLIHDIGVMVEMQFDRTKLIEVIEQCSPDDEGVPAVSMIEIEERVLGATHMEFGAALCKKWKFPHVFELATRWHHDPSGAPAEHRRIVTLVAVADKIAAQIAEGFRLDQTDTTITNEELDVLQLTAEKLEELKPKIAEAIEQFDLAS